MINQWQEQFTSCWCLHVCFFFVVLLLLFVRWCTNEYDNFCFFSRVRTFDINIHFALSIIQWLYDIYAHTQSVIPTNVIKSIWRFQMVSNKLVWSVCVCLHLRIGSFWRAHTDTFGVCVRVLLLLRTNANICIWQFDNSATTGRPCFHVACLRDLPHRRAHCEQVHILVENNNILYYLRNHTREMWLWRLCRGDFSNMIVFIHCFSSFFHIFSSLFCSFSFLFLF